MGDLFYSTIIALGRVPVWVSSRPVVLNREHLPRSGAFILAANHFGAYDIPLLMRHVPRRLDFVSIVEIFRKPLAGWFLSRMNAFPLDRHRADPATVRIILDRLERGRVVAMFPEGRVRAPGESVVHGGTLRPGLTRIARLANAPIVPAVVLNSSAYAKISAWMPLRRTRYGVAFGEPIAVHDEQDAEQRLMATYRALYAQLLAAGLRAVYSENMPNS
jgi:1-acyl-sn-glycerol-3-phosphate acyltransferase